MSSGHLLPMGTLVLLVVNKIKKYKRIPANRNVRKQCSLFKFFLLCLCGAFVRYWFCLMVFVHVCFNYCAHTYNHFLHHEWGVILTRAWLTPVRRMLCTSCPCGAMLCANIHRPTPIGKMMCTSCPCGVML